jgi:hypothetical protein
MKQYLELLDHVLHAFANFSVDTLLVADLADLREEEAGDS